MGNFKKIYNLKIISILIGVSYLFTSSLYAMPFSKDTIVLRVPMRTKKTRWEGSLQWGSEERGIINVRETLQRNNPELIARYDRFLSLPESEEKEVLQKLLCNDIYRITSGHFKVWGIGTALVQGGVPYFKGSHIVALEKVFPELELNRLRFGLDWTSEEQSKTSIRYVLSREQPNIIAQYNKLDLLTTSEKEKLRRDIYRITSGHFAVWGIGRAMDSRSLPYFKGSHITALQQVFPKLRLNPLGFQLAWLGEEHGIASIRYVLLRERPSTIEQYDKVDTLSESQKDALRADIYQISNGHFQLWGLSRAMDFRATPYFKGSYITVLQKVFPKLHLNPLGFQLDWATKEQGIASIRYVLFRERPDIISRYDRLDLLTSSEIEKLRRDIYSITFGHFIGWGLGAAIDPDRAPYFNRSYIVALQEVFPKLQFNPLGFQLDWSVEEKAIESIRYVLLREMPDIIERYDNLDSLNELEKKRLQRDIYKISQAHFSVWGISSVLKLTTAPYFQGSFIIVLQKVFPKLELNRLGFQLDWSGKKQAIESIRYVLLRERPDIIKRYDNLDSLNDQDKRILLTDIFKISHAHFRLWGLSAAMNAKLTPFFKGSYMTALASVFSDKRLGFSEEGLREFRKNTTVKRYSWETKIDGISNVKVAMRINRPHLMAEYDRFASLPESEEKENLRKVLCSEIYQITQGHFGTWGISSAMSSQVAPYFYGSHIIALVTVFPELHLNPLGFQLEWTTKEQGIASINYVLSRERPDIIERYNNFNSLSELQKDALRFDIYQISAGHFQLWGLDMALHSRRAYYSYGSHITALQEVFPELELNPLRFQLDWSTKEQGIASIRDVLMSERPNIIERYNRFDTLSEAEKDALRFDIYQINQGHFRLWGLQSAMNLNTISYFNCSYIIALQEVFPNLELNRLGFQLDWSTKKQGIASIRYVLSRERPDIIRRYDAFDSLSESERDVLRSDIYQITLGHMHIWGLGGGLVIKEVPYFYGSYITALQEVFPNLELNRLGFQLDWSTKKQGIASIRYVLSRERPDIIQRYYNFESLGDLEKEILRSDIYSIGKRHFKVWGLEAGLNKRKAFYFKGSYITALQEVFSNLELNPLGFRLDWSTERQAIASVRYVFSRERLDIVKRYDNLDSLNELEKEELRQNIYSINYGFFAVWGITAATNLSYFKRSYIVVLQKVFPRLNLERSRFRIKGQDAVSPITFRTVTESL